MSTTAPAAANTAAVAAQAKVAAAASTAPRVVPTPAMHVRVPWGDWLVQLEEVMKGPVEDAVVAGYTQLMPNLAQLVIGPSVIKGYMDQGITALENLEHGRELDVGEQDGLFGWVANQMMTFEPHVVKWLGDEFRTVFDTVVKATGLAKAA